MSGLADRLRAAAAHDGPWPTADCPDVMRAAAVDVAAMDRVCEAVDAVGDPDALRRLVAWLDPGGRAEDDRLRLCGEFLAAVADALAARTLAVAPPATCPTCLSPDPAECRLGDFHHRWSRSGFGLCCPDTFHQPEEAP